MLRKQKLFSAIIVLLSLILDINKIYEARQITLYFKDSYIFALLLFILIFTYLKKERVIKSWSINLLSVILSIILLVGDSFNNQGSFSLLISNYYITILAIIKTFGYYCLIRTILTDLYQLIDNYSFKNIKDNNNKINSTIIKHPIICSMLFIIICWLPYIISYYPAILSPDPSYQIQQFFGIRTKYNDYSIMLDDSITITNHHPVIHTVLLGGSLKLGRVIFNNDNIGLFIYSIIQILILSFTLSFTIYYMKKLKIPLKYRKICLLIYSLLPIFPFYAMSAVKDVIFSCFIILYSILFYDILKKRNNEKLKIHNILIYIIIMLFTFLFRNNGIHVILLTFPILFIVDKLNRKKLSLMYCIIIILYFLYSSWLLPTLKITSGSVREVLSIPFQQTARYVTYYSDDVTNDEKKAIDKVLGYNDLAKRYNPEKADPVKNKFNKYTTSTDLRKYFEVWLKQFIKHPMIYVEATINNTYGYFYPNRTSWYIYHDFDDRIVKKGFNYHYNSLEKIRLILSNIATILPKIPIIGLLVNIGFYVWIMLFIVSYLLYKKKYIDLLYLLPSFVSLLVCVASPVNTYFRYAMPFIFAMPLSVALFIDIIKKD